MEEQTYKVRVEASVIIEVDVAAVHEDEAGAAAEEIAHEIITEQLRNVEDEDAYIAAWGVRAVDVEPVDYEKGE